MNEVQFTHEFLGCHGRVRITIRAGEQLFADEFKVTSAKARERFAAKACERFGALDEPSVLAELERVVKDYGPYSERQKAEERLQNEQDDAQRELDDRADTDVLVAIAEDKSRAVLFRTPAQHDAQAFAVLVIGETRQTCPVASKVMRQWLLREFRRDQDRLPGRNALDAAIFAIEAITVQSDNAAEAYVRFAAHDGSIYIDLGDDTWRAVRISASGWQVVKSVDVPVHFQRRYGMKALPVPEPGGALGELFEFVNVPEGEQRCLFLAWLVACIRPLGPYPILIINGEQGSAKSTTCRRARDLVDPSIAPLRRFPRDDRDLMIAAKNGWLLCYDNISSIQPSMSDALCSLATGGGLGTRQLYSDDSEALFCATRPILLNGIPDIATRPDLIDRAIFLHLPRIPAGQRADEEMLDGRFQAAHPRILGALLDVISKAIARYPHVQLSGMPRMADFAKFGAAAAEALGYSERYFLEAYQANGGAQADAVIESSPLAMAVIDLMRAQFTWRGSATELLSELARVLAPGQFDHVPRAWPTCPSGLVNDLRRLAPLLRARGIEIETGKRENGDDRRRYLVISKVEHSQPVAGLEAHEPSASAQTGRGGEVRGGGPRCRNCGGNRLWHPPGEPASSYSCGDCTPPVAGADVVWISPGQASEGSGHA